LKTQTVKVGKLKISGANLHSLSQYYQVKAREVPNLNEDYLEITRRNVALLQIN
jgi:hypothetical protein